MDQDQVFEYDRGDRGPDPSDLTVGMPQGDSEAENGPEADPGDEIDPGASQASSQPLSGDPLATQSPGNDWSILGSSATDPMGVPLPQYVDPTRTLGPFDAYCAVVVQVFSPGSVHPVTNCANSIVVRRCSVSWDRKYNYPTIGPLAMAASGPTPTLASPFPWPVRHDQAGYLVKAGDVVSVLQGRDGRAWYMVDDLPFVATVWGQITTGYESKDKFPTKDNDDPAKRAMVDDIALAADSSKYYRFDGLDWAETPKLSTAGDTGKASETGEWHAGNAGYWCIDVRRRILGPTYDSKTADPDSSAFEGATSPLVCQTGDDLKRDSTTYVTYRHVRVVCPPMVHHGYRPGDPVIVFKRGRYFFCLPGRQFFLAKIINGGPQGEPDFDGAGAAAKVNHYWVKELTRTVTYDTANVWLDNVISEAVYSSAPPDMSVPGFVHWVDAINLAEPAGSHRLAVDGSEIVIVHIFASPDTGQPWYAFERINWSDALCGSQIPVPGSPGQA